MANFIVETGFIQNRNPRRPNSKYSNEIYRKVFYNYRFMKNCLVQKGVTYAQAASIYSTAWFDEPKPQRVKREVLNYNVPAPTPEQKRFINAWLKKNGWRTSKFAEYQRKTRSEGFTLCGNRFAQRRLWDRVYHPTKICKLECSNYEPGVVTPTSKKQIKKTNKYKYRKEDISQQGVYKHKYIDRTRDPKLLIKLHIKILELILIRLGPKKGSLFWNKLVEKYQVVSGEGQMPQNEEVNAESIGVQKVGDTAYVTHEQPDTAVENSHNIEPAVLSSSDPPSRIDKVTTRGFIIDTITWDKTKGFGEILKTYDLPQDYVKVAKNSPQWMNVRSHAYFRPEYITLEFLVNASRFCIGQLQVSVYFDSNYDAKKRYRNNVFTRSQLLHTIIDAGSSAPVILKIPYKHYNPWIVNREDNYSNVFQVQVIVLYPFRTGDHCVSAANISVRCTFENLEFIGLCASDLHGASGEMLPMLATIASSYLNNYLADQNRDKPPVQPNPVALEPRATGSIALGTNTVEVLQPLRLDARGQVPHLVTTDMDYDVRKLAQRYALVTMVSWKRDHGTGTSIWSCPAGPLWDLSFYQKFSIYPDSNKNNSVQAYCIPPCGILASLYNVFTGSIKLRFDIVGSFAHTGTLLVAFIPGYCSNTDPGIEKAKSSYHMTFDIHSQRSFEFQVPYIADKPWWPVEKLDTNDPDRIPCYGTVWLYVLNPVLCMDSIPADVGVLVYCSGGPDLNFAVPVQPQLALPWYLDTPEPPSDHDIKALDGYYPYYPGNWTWYLGGTKGAVLRYGPIYDHVAQFGTLSQGNVSSKEWFYYTTTDPNIKMYTDQGTYTKDDIILVPLDVKDGNGAIYLAVCLKDHIKYLFPKRYTKGSQPSWDFQTFIVDEDKSAYSTHNPLLSRASFLPDKVLSRGSSKDTLDSYEDLTGIGEIGDNRQSGSQVIVPVGNQPVSLPLMTFGEEFTDIKTLCRRYELLATFKVNVDPDRLPFQNDARFFVLPQGNSLNVDSMYVQSVGRDGMQAILMACARHFVGSVNLKFVVDSNVGTLWVQHKPDTSISFTNIQRFGYNLDDVTYLNGYASAVTSCAVNSTLTVNVPYYNPNSLLLLQVPQLTHGAEARRAMSLGEITVGFNCPSTKITIPITVYKSLGDDAALHTYVGWPPMVPQYIYKHVPSKSNNVDEEQHPSGSGEIGFTVKLEKKQFDNISNLVETVISKSFEGIIDKTKSTAKKYSAVAFLIMTAVPSKSVFSWCSAIVGVAVELDIISCDSMSSVTSKLASCFSIEESKQHDSNIALSGEGQAPEDESKYIAAITALWQGIAIALGFKAQPHKPRATIAHHASTLMELTKNQAIATRGFLSFFENIFVVIKNLIGDIVAWYNPELRQLSQLQTAGVMVREFVVECRALRKIFGDSTPIDQNLANRVESAAFTGDSIVKVAISTPGAFSPQHWTIISNELKFISDKRDEMLKKGVCSVSRYTPYCLWVFGEPGVGKSVASTSFASVIIENMKIESNNPIFTKPATSKYFTNLTPSQQIYVFDDFGQFTHSDPEISDPAILIHLKSCAPYNPPMAAVEDKPLLVAPKAIICHANSGWPISNNITDIRALHRRRDLVVEAVQIKPKPVIFAGDNLSFDHLEYYLHDQFGPTKRQGPYTHKQICDILALDIQRYDKEEKLLCNARITAITKHISNSVSPHTVTAKINNNIANIVEELNSDFEELKQHSGNAIINSSIQRVKKIFAWSENKQIKEQTGGEIFDQIVESESEPVVEAAKTNDILQYTKNLIEKANGDINYQASTSGEGQIRSRIDQTKPWHHVYSGECFCDHSHPLFPYSQLHNNRMVLLSEDGTGAVSKVFSLSKCPEKCAANTPWFCDAILNIFSSVTYASLIQSKGYVTNHILAPPAIKDDWTDYIRKGFKKCIASLGTVVKTIMKILRIVLVSVVPAVLAVAALWASITGICAGARYLSGSNKDEEGNKIKNFSSCYYDEFNRLYEAEEEYERQAKENAAYIRTARQLMERELNREGESQNAYEIKTPFVKTKNSIKPATRSGTVEIGQSRELSWILLRNTVWITVTGKSKLTNCLTTSTARGFAVCDRYIMIPRHYLQEWDCMTGKIVTFHMHMRPAVECLYDSLKFSTYKFRELCVMHVPKLQCVKDVRSHFASASSWQKPRNVNVVITEIDQKYNRTVHNSDSKIYDNFQLKYEGATLAILPAVIRYNVQGKGKCMCVVQDTRGFIVGFHIAGDGTFGYAEPVVMESYNDLLDGITDFQAPEDVIQGWGEIDKIRTKIDTCVETIGKIPNKYVRYETGKTAILPSEIHGVFPLTTMPVPLRPCEMNQYTDPLVEGCKKHGLPDLGFDTITVKTVEHALGDRIIQVAKPLFENVRIWSPEEAINGLPSTPSFGRLVMSTSEGFPYIFERPPNTSGKEWLLNPGQLGESWVYHFHPRLKEIMEKKDNMRRKGIVPFTPFIDCLKDERLKIEKCKIPGKARIFSVAPLDYLIQYRQTFADFTVAYISRGEELHHSIGIAAERMDWTHLTRNLQTKGDKIVCGDYKNFGPAFSIEMHQAVNRIKQRWYDYYGATSEDQLVRQCFAREVENAYHMANDNLYRLICGAPSGAPDTTEKNSLVNTLLIMYVWVQIWQDIDPEMATIDRMNHHVWFTTYGDDFIANVSDEAIVYFNNVNIQKVFAKHGVTYTDDTKDNNIRPYCLLSEATFLKRHFVPHPTRRGIMCGALDKEKQTDIANWIRKCDNTQEASREVAVQCSLLAFGWGKQYYNHIRQVILDAWNKKNISTILEIRTWQEVDRIYFGYSTQMTDLKELDLLKLTI